MATGGGEDRNALTVLWNIQNLPRFLVGFHWNKVSSLKLHPLALGGDSIQLSLCVRGENAADQNVHLRLQIPHRADAVDCEFSLLACDGYPLVTRRGKRLDVSNGASSYEVIGLLTQEELFVTKKSTFLPHDTLTIRCRVWKSEGHFPSAEFVSTCSRIEFGEESLFWPVGEFGESSLSRGYAGKMLLDCVHESVQFGLKCSLTDDSKLKVVLTTDGLIRDYLVKLEASVSDSRHEILKLGEKDFFFSQTLEHTWEIPIFDFSENLREKISLSLGRDLCLHFRLTAVCKDISECIEKTLSGNSTNLLCELVGDCLPFAAASEDITPRDVRSVPSPQLDEERNTITILWRIENLTHFEKGFSTDFGIESPAFYPLALKENLVLMSFWLESDILDDEKVHLLLKRVPDGVDCEVALVGCDGPPLVARTGKGSDFRDCEDDTGLLTREELFVTKKSTFLPHGTLTVRCRLWKSKGNLPNSEFFSARTRIEFAESSVWWPIVKNDSRRECSVSFHFRHEPVLFRFYSELTTDSLRDSGLCVTLTAYEMLEEYIVTLEVYIWDNRRVTKLGKKDFFFSSKEERYSSLFPDSEHQHAWKIHMDELSVNLREKLSCDDGLSLLFNFTAVCRDKTECIEETFVGTFQSRVVAS